MALNIKDRETEELAGEVARIARESKTQAVKVALRERRERLLLSAVRHDRSENIRSFLEEEAWPQISPEVLSSSMSRDERERILGYGPEGV